MITNELNTGLVNAVREKLPSKDNLANALMDILYIGKEAIYRRLRGEVPFTLTEAAIISRNKPLETYYSILEKQVELFHAVEEDEN